MERLSTEAIVLKRQNYGEADRILELFTRVNGRVSAIAKGVRRPKSKLAGGIELFAVNDVTLIRGKGELMVLSSSRVNRAYQNLISDYETMQSAYLILQVVRTYLKDAHDNTETFFDTTSSSLHLLNAHPQKRKIIMCWFFMQILRLSGSTPNLRHDDEGRDLREEAQYQFLLEDGAFSEAKTGSYEGSDIKAWRVFVNATESQIISISGLQKSAEKSYDDLARFTELQA